MSSGQTLLVTRASLGLHQPDGAAAQAVAAVRGAPAPYRLLTAMDLEAVMDSPLAYHWLSAIDAAAGRDRADTVIVADESLRIADRVAAALRGNRLPSRPYDVQLALLPAVAPPKQGGAAVLTYAAHAWHSNQAVLADVRKRLGVEATHVIARLNGAADLFDSAAAMELFVSEAEAAHARGEIDSVVLLAKACRTRRLQPLADDQLAAERRLADRHLHAAHYALRDAQRGSRSARPLRIRHAFLLTDERGSYRGLSHEGLSIRDDR
jgi:hypothetical protein